MMLSSLFYIKLKISLTIEPGIKRIRNVYLSKSKDLGKCCSDLFYFYDMLYKSTIAFSCTVFLSSAISMEKLAYSTFLIIMFELPPVILGRNPLYIILFICISFQQITTKENFTFKLANYWSLNDFNSDKT